jgi:hypothetical protein
MNSSLQIPPKNGKLGNASLSFSQGGENAHVSSLLPHERLALTRESRVRDLFEKRSAEWSRFREESSKKLQRPPSQSVVASSDDFRAKQEDLTVVELAQHQVQERHSADDWRASLRAGKNTPGVTFVLVGNAFTGIWGAIKERRPEDASIETVRGRPPRHVTSFGEKRRSRSSEVAPGDGPEGGSVIRSASVAGGERTNRRGEENDAVDDPTDGADVELHHELAKPRGSFAWREQEAMKKTMQHYAPQIKAVRSHDLSADESSNLIVTGESLLEWASRSAGVDPRLLRGRNNEITTNLGPHSTEILQGSQPGGEFMDNVSGNNLVSQRVDLTARTASGVPSHGMQGGNHFALERHGMTFGELRDDGMSKPSVDHMNEAIALHQGDLVRASLIAGNVWHNINKMLHQQPPGGVGDLNSLGSGSFRDGSVTTPTGSVVAVRKVHLMRLGTDPLQGPHAHLQVVSDNVTTKDDIGASVGTTGRLPPFRRLLSAYNHDATAAAVFIASSGGFEDDQGRSNTIEGQISNQDSTFEDWDNSLVLGRKNPEHYRHQHLMETKRSESKEMGTTQLFSSTGATTAFLQANSSASRSMSVARGWPEVALESSTGAQAVARIRFANTGTTVLYYKWVALGGNGKPKTAWQTTTKNENNKVNALDQNGSVSQPNASDPIGSLMHLDATLPLMNSAERFSESIVLGDSSSSVVVLPNAVSASRGPRFICAKLAGSITPGAVTDFLFTFEAMSPGVFTELWQLETVPPCNNATPIIITLRGVSTRTDETAPKRVRLDKKLHSAVSFSMCREIMNDLIDSLDLEAPPVPAHDVRVEIERKAFTRLNPDLYYHENIYEALDKQVAQPAFNALSVHPRKRVWSGSIPELHALVSKVLPGPETEAERYLREELERQEALEAQRKEDERIASEAAAAAAAQAAAEAAAAAIDLKNKKKGATKDMSRPITPAAPEEPKHSEVISVVSLPEQFKVVVETPTMKRERLTNLYHSLMARLGSLTVAASKRPIEESPLYHPIRTLLLDLVDLIPFAAGGSKEAEKLELKSEVESSSNEVSLRSWSDQRPHDEHQQELLKFIYGKNGRPPPRVRAMRPKLGRDGEYHMVPVDPNDGFDDPPEEEEDEAEVDIGDETEEDFNSNFLMRETFNHFSRRIASETFSAKDSVRENARHDEMRKAQEAADAAAREKALAEQAAQNKGKVGAKVPTLSPVAELRTIPDVQTPESPQPQAALGLDLHPLANIVPKLPDNAWSLGDLQASGIEEDGTAGNKSGADNNGQTIKYLMRFAFVVRKLVYQCLSKVGEASLDIETQCGFENRDKIKMNLIKKLTLHDVIVDGKIVLVRSGYDLIPHKLLRRVSADIKLGESSSSVDLLSRNASFLSSIPTITTAVEKNARLIIIASAQGTCPLPYPDNVSHRRGVMMTSWPPNAQETASNDESKESVGTCEGFSMVLNDSQVAPIQRDVTLERSVDADSAKSMAEMEGEAEEKILAQVQLASTSEKNVTCKPVLRVFSASSLIGIALALSNVVSSRSGNGSYVIFTLLNSFENTRVFFQGRELLKRRDKNDNESKFEQESDAFLKAVDECITSASDFSDFSRNLSTRSEIPFGTLVVLENLLHPSSYASEVGSKRVFGLTRLISDIPFAQSSNETLLSSNNSTTAGSKILNSLRVADWKAHHVSLWLSHLCMGIHHESEWNKYVDSFARAGVDGGVLISWLSPALGLRTPFEVPGLGPQFANSLKSLGIEDMMHQQLIESALLALIPRIESEDIAFSRIQCIDLWASKQADMASAAMRTAANEIGATMRIQSLLRGHIARRRAAQKKNRETQKAPVSSHKTSKRSEMVDDKKKRLKHSGADQIKLLASPAGSLTKDSSSDVGNDFITKSKGPDAHSVRFAAFSTELTSFAFLSKAARGQAAFRAVLSSCCDVFVQDSLLASLDETASSSGVRPHRTASNLLRLKDAQSNHKVGAADMRKKKKKNAANKEKPKRNLIQMTQEENAAVNIQRIAKGRKARRDVMELKATMSKDKEHHTRLRRTTSSPAIADTVVQRAGDGCRVAGLHLCNEISIIGGIIQPVPRSMQHSGPHSPAKGPVLSILGGGGNLFQKVAALETLINCSDAVFLGGLIGFAWLAHTSPAFWSGSSSKKALSLASSSLGLTSSICSGFHNIGVDLRRLALFAEKKKVTIIAPIDAIACVKNMKSPMFDTRIFNPKPLSGGGQAASASSSVDDDFLSDELSLIESSHTKLLCDAPEETHEEDEVPDEDYDSDNSDDMMALKDRNTRIKNRNDAFENLRKARMDDLLRRANTRPEHILEMTTSSLLGPSLSVSSGLCVPIPGPFHSLSNPFFVTPDSEASNFEFDTENAQMSTRTIDLLALSVVGANNAVDPNAFFQPDEIPIDVGPSTMEVLLEALQGAKQVIVYGPLGVVEILDGAASTVELLSALEARELETLKSVLVGGSLLAFANRVKKGISSASLISRNGGVLLSSKMIPGLAMLSEKDTAELVSSDN